MVTVTDNSVLPPGFNEQSAREIYLVPFEMCMKVGDVTLNYVEKQEDGSYANASKSIRASQGVMTSLQQSLGATWQAVTMD